ncbi:MAG: SRPBCC family protein [Catenulispora sp.]|nr:SRPBCC family protein [Catenulispora sp.]
MRWTIPAAAGGAVLGFALAAYPALWRDRCLTWGARPVEVEREMAGDKLLPDAPVVSTRAITVDAPPSAIWPWLVQMGPHRGGAYTYDWIENLFRLDMHSADEIIPELQNLAVGDELPLGTKLTMRIEVLDPEQAMVMHSDDGAWVWSFGLYPQAAGTTRLVSRNRIQDPRTTVLTSAFSIFVMEPGSLIMERKMLLGIKERAERLVRSAQPAET